MKLRKFTAEKVHGIADFEVRFNPDLTFLVGINGSGKTTIVNGVSALIAPSIPMLAQIVYSRMEVELESDSKIIRIWATQDQEVIRLFSSQTAEPLQIPILIKDSYSTASRNDILAYYREEETRNAKHPVIALVKSLPLLCFLISKDVLNLLPN